MLLWNNAEITAGGGAVAQKRLQASEISAATSSIRVFTYVHVKQNLLFPLIRAFAQTISLVSSTGENETLLSTLYKNDGILKGQYCGHIDFRNGAVTKIKTSFFFFLPSWY